MGILDKVGLGKLKHSREAALIAQVKALEQRFDDEYTERLLDAATSHYVSTMDFLSPEQGQLHSAINFEVDVAQLQRLYATEGWFNIAVNTIAGSIAGLPVKVERKQAAIENGTSTVSWVDASGEREAKVFAAPNDISTPFEFWYLVLVDLLSTGDAFIYVDYTDHYPTDEERARGVRSYKEVQGIYRINPSLIEPMPAENGKYLEGYMLYAFGQKRMLTREMVINVKLPNPLDPFRGMAPIVPVLKNLLIDRYSTEHMIAFWKAGARIGGAITTDEKLTKDQLRALQRSFENDFTGRKNQHRTLIMPKGFDYKPIESDPGETSLIEFQRFNREPILSAYKVPPVMAGLLDGATYANANVQMKAFYTNTVVPYVNLISMAMSPHPALFPPEKGLRMRHDTSGIQALQDDEKAKADTGKAMLESGMSPNEVRKKIWQLPPVDGGDKVPVVERMTAPAPVALAAKPVTQKADPPSVQPDTNTVTDIIPTGITFQQRVAMLTNQMVAAGTPVDLAVMAAIERALQEGYKPTVAQAEPAPEAGKADESNPEIQPVGVAGPGPKKPEPENKDQSCDDGRHTHVYAASATETTGSDGQHKHAFRKPDGTLVWTSEDGTHKHLDVGPDASQTPGGAHAHAIEGGTTAEGPDGAHTHEYLEAGTTLSGSHTHKWAMPDGTVLISMTEADLALDKDQAVQAQPVVAAPAVVNPIKPPQPDMTQPAPPPAKLHPFTPEQIDEKLKALTEHEAVTAMIAKRHKEATEFYDELGKLYLGKLQKNLRKYGLYFKAEGDDDLVDSDELDRALKEQIERLLAGSIGEAGKYGYDQALVEFDLSYPNTTAQAALGRTAARNVRYVSRTVKDDIRKIVTEATGEATSITEIARQLREYFGETQTAARAERIARTEVLQAVSVGQDIKNQEFFKEYPEEKGNVQKVWITSRDERVRGNPEGKYPPAPGHADHWELDGQVQDYGEPFSNGLMYPRQPKAPANEVINCRCAWTSFHKGDLNEVQQTVDEGSPNADV